jgi:hypothetical protein
LKNVAFRDMAPCRCCVIRRFGENYCLHIQGLRIRKRGTSVSRGLQSSTLKMDVIRSSETSVHTKST